jgi:hypothetical protein
MLSAGAPAGLHPLHHQGLPEEIAYERAGLTLVAVAALTGMGYKLVEQRSWGAVEIDRDRERPALWGQ